MKELVPYRSRFYQFSGNIFPRKRGIATMRLYEFERIREAAGGENFRRDARNGRCTNKRGIHLASRIVRHVAATAFVMVSFDTLT